MQFFIFPSDGDGVAIPALPKNRAEAIFMIREYFGKELSSEYRIVTIDEYDVSDDETTGIETFALGLRYYGANEWGLTEIAGDASLEIYEDFKPTVNDVALWVSQLQNSLKIEESKFRCEFDSVEDFYVMQFFNGDQLSTSITWNDTDSITSFLLPKTLEMNTLMWGDGFLDDVDLVRTALQALRII